MTELALQLEQAKNGDEAALAFIMSRLMQTIHYYANKMTCPGLDFEDAVQEGIIALYRAVKTFRPNANASFRTYASVCIRNGIADAARAAGQKNHQPLNASTPLEESEQETTAGPEQIAIEREAYRLRIRQINSLLSPFEKKVLRCKLSGLGATAISAQLGCEKKRVDNALWRMRRKLKR